MLRTVLLRALLFLSVLGLFFSSWLLWLNDSLDVRINNNFPENSLSNDLNIGRYAFLFSSPTRSFLKQSITDPNSDNVFLLELLNQYLDENPLDANVWVIGSKLYQRENDIESASKYLAVAYRLSKTNTIVLFNIFNRYLELGLIESALPVAHDLVLAKPNEFRRIYYLMSRLTDNYSLLVDQMIPKKRYVNGLIKKQFSFDQYFYWRKESCIHYNRKHIFSAMTLPPKTLPSQEKPVSSTELKMG